MLMILLTRPSDLVTSETGADLQKKMWTETDDVLNRYTLVTMMGELDDII